MPLTTVPAWSLGAGVQCALSESESEASAPPTPLPKSFSSSRCRPSAPPSNYQQPAVLVGVEHLSRSVQLSRPPVSSVEAPSVAPAAPDERRTELDAPAAHQAVSAMDTAPVASANVLPATGAPTAAMPQRHAAAHGDQAGAAPASIPSTTWQPVPSTVPGCWMPTGAGHRTPSAPSVAAYFPPGQAPSPTYFYCYQAAVAPPAPTCILAVPTPAMNFRRGATADARAPWDKATLRRQRADPGPGAYDPTHPTRISFNAKFTPNPEMVNRARLKTLASFALREVDDPFSRIWMGPFLTHMGPFRLSSLSAWIWRLCCPAPG
jgi:hypothetical protein